MREGSRVKMGYVTYGMGGKKKGKSRAGLKKQGVTYMRRKTGGAEKKYERKHTKRDRAEGNVCVCVIVHSQREAACNKHMGTYFTHSGRENVK